jgi:hypothetical protein
MSTAPGLGSARDGWHRPHARPMAAVAAVLSCLTVSALALAVAPMLMPESYSWVVHTTSESAAQGVNGAWLARLGFVAFGFAVLART